MRSDWVQGTLPGGGSKPERWVVCRNGQTYSAGVGYIKHTAAAASSKPLSSQCVLHSHSNSTNLPGPCLLSAGHKGNTVSASEPTQKQGRE